MGKSLSNAARGFGVMLTIAAATSMIATAQVPDPVPKDVAAKDAKEAAAKEAAAKEAAKEAAAREAAAREAAAKEAAAKDAAVRNNVQSFSSKTYEESFKVLFVTFVVAMVLESALAVLFNWRVFLMLVHVRVVRPVVAVVFAYFFVTTFNLDVVRQLIAAYSPADVPPPNFATQFISALILAGGSAGVNNLLVGLGFREVRTPEQVLPKPEPDKAWLAVNLVREEAEGAVYVLIGSDPDPAQLRVVGTIPGKSRRFWDWIFLNQGRFPGAGGWSIQPGRTVVKLKGVKRGGGEIESPHPWDNAVAKGAILDLTMKL